MKSQLSHIAMIETDQPRGFEPNWELKGTLCGSLPGNKSAFAIGSWGGEFEAACDHCGLLKTTIEANIGTIPESLLITRQTNWKPIRANIAKGAPGVVFHHPVQALRYFAWWVLGPPRKGPRFEQDAYKRWLNVRGHESTLFYAQARENAPRGCWNCCVPIPDNGLCPVCAATYSSRDVMQLNKPR